MLFARHGDIKQTIWQNMAEIVFSWGVREQSLLMPGGGAEDISKLMVNFSWPLIL
jgi:hypothetical protein